MIKAALLVNLYKTINVHKFPNNIALKVSEYLFRQVVFVTNL